MSCLRFVFLAAVAFALLPARVSAIPDYVQHTPGAAVYGEPAGVTMREEEVPREDETVSLWVSVGYSYYYTDVAVYYTTDGSDPQGSFGVGSGTTSVLRSSTGGVTFIRNETHSPANIDWWKTVLPASTRTYGLLIKYKIGAWHASGGAEIFANNSGCSDGTCDDPSAPATIFSYRVRLAWPGIGHPSSTPGVGYPNVHLWKEEAVVGNNWMNVQLDQNGSIYDIYYPSAGCMQGVGTKNEGYVDGNDTFPPGLPLGCRGQMNMNIGCAGLRVDGVTYWFTNEGAAYSNVSQSYQPDTNVVRTNQTLTAGGSNIAVTQYDFCPKGIAYPNDSSGTPVRGLHIKRILLTNNGASAKTLNLYYFADPATNGGDGYDVMSFDSSRGAMLATDQTYRTTSTSGEYNPTSYSDYAKNMSISFASALKLCMGVGGSTGALATESWRDSSSDNSQGWIGIKLTLAAGQSSEVDLVTVGGDKQGAGDPGTPSLYNGQIVPALGWFFTNSAATLQTATETYWTNWLATGTTVAFPDARYDSLFKRSLLATALHVDEKGGGVIAGMHNGAYPFIWPRDAVYAAITLDRTGHTSEAENVYRFLREVAYRANEEPTRKGFWYQKYTTDGYSVWTAPQVDETAVVPWGVRYHYDTLGDSAFLTNNYQMVYEAARASSEDSTVDARLYYDDPAMLMHANNVWEDSWDDFLYSNACVEKGLRDAAAIATVTGHPAESALFTSRANTIHSGILGRLTWDGENTDISQLGITYPYESLPANDSRMQHILGRINGTATDRWGNNHPITNSSGEFAGLVNRYWGDTYWNGGPWFLSTLWYGQFHARLQDYFAGKAQVDVLKDKIDLLIGRLGPMGLGAEQIAPSTSLLYSGQGDFSLQAAWPNAWESMSTILDSIMLFLDYRPDASANRFSIAPKLPTGWSTLTFSNIRLGSGSFNVTCSESEYESREVFTNLSAGAIGFDTTVRVPGSTVLRSVTINGVPISYTYSASTGQVKLSGSLAAGVGSVTTVSVFFANAPTLTPRQIKSTGTNVPAYVDGVVVTRVHADRFNVETADRSSGVAVIGTGAQRGEQVKLFGTTGLSGAERVLHLTQIVEQVDAPETPKPLGMAARSLGGSGFGLQHGITNGFGLSNTGLDVMVFGAIRKIAPDGSYITVDDGSGLTDIGGFRGIRLVGALNTGRFAEGQFVGAIGSSSILESSGVYYPLVRIADPGDIVRY